MNRDPAGFHDAIPFVASPNHSERTRSLWLGTVIHFTGSRPGTRGDIAWLCNPASSASAHFVIGRDGAITQLVSLDRCAWHAGQSALPLRSGKKIAGCNSTCLGIELDNLGPVLEDPDGEGWVFEAGNALLPYVGEPPVRATLEWPGGPQLQCLWEPYPAAQIDALEHLLGLLGEAGHHAAAQNLIGHEEVAIPFGRKRDPGPLFPWSRFSRLVPRVTLAY